MRKNYYHLTILTICFIGIFSLSALSQIGTRFPSELKEIKDPVTGARLTFLTSKPAGDSKIYQTHPQWTSDGNWLIFRSNRVRGEAMAVNEKTGVIVQVTEGGYTGMLCVARKSMKLYVMRFISTGTERPRGGAMQVVVQPAPESQSKEADHPHPTFSPDGTKIEIQSAMLSEDNRSMNICIIYVPETWLKRK